MPGGKGKITGKDGKPFKKGDKRINRAGRPPKLPGLDELLSEVLTEDIDGKQAMRAVLVALRGRALKGDVRAAELILDRAYGKLKSVKDIEFNYKDLSAEQLETIINEILNIQSNENNKDG